MIPTMRCWQNLPNVASHVRCHMQMLQTQKCSCMGLRKLRGYVGGRTQLLQVQKSTYVGLHRLCRDSASSVQWGLPTLKEPSSSFTSASTSSSSTASSPRKEPALLECSDEQTRTVAERDFSVIPDFVTEAEEGLLLKEVERFLKKVRYEYDHWDNAIHGFRETEKSRWSDDNGLIIQRIRDVAFPSSSHQLSLVHVLDLASNGYIKPHVDSIKFCGPTIAGLSLLSPAIMRLVHTDDSSRWVNALLRPRSLYIMRDSIRYDFTHEVLKDEESVFKGEPVKRGRRISIMCRNEAPST